ncbi:M20/M25/M40 family metallo-hydrolase [Brevibacillus nitrificans]|uniref:M20/M25/M40 family metallo-hydrolase n=1 Tax=Brevibacillus nitrificans TaxID=651560 RepID=A0A3M8D6K7_9BACL|nr:M20/M25/M40 family metallo-hydrolase [Brevibacillus nitrificans]RNB83684.1 M20/M25/M40 family metallo-hydrolase [Brevibacillus nitrificans]
MKDQGRTADAIAVNEERLLNSFLELACINAPSGNEQPVADYLVQRLTKLGFSLQFDQAHHAFGGSCGNLIAWWEGTDSDIPPLFFSTHMDTVLPTKGLVPVIRDGVIYSDGTTILGADDRAALAAYLEAIEVIQEKGTRCGPIELILTVNEQPGLVGATHLDYSLVRSEAGYIFDSSGDVGQIILQGPYSSRIWWEVQGKSSHIGLNPEEGISAFLIAAEALTRMRLGKIDDQTLANVGVIEGGELTSIIPGKVKMGAEVRSFSAEGLKRQIEHMVQTVEDAAMQHGGTATARIEKKYLGFQAAPDDLHVRTALAAAEKIGVEPYLTKTLGGADTNVLNENGLSCITLGLGFRNIHTFKEHISIENLFNTGKCVISLIEEWRAAHQ